MADPQTNRRVVLLDLNPDFRLLAFGRVEAIQWKGTDGSIYLKLNRIKLISETKRIGLLV